MNILRSLPLCALLVLGASSAQAQVYPWMNWTSTGPQSASATDGFLGTVTVVTTGVTSTPDTSAVTPFPIQFDGVVFTPVNAPSVGLGNIIVQDWSFDVSFAATVGSAGVVVGLGNFGHGTASYPGYRLSAFDTFGNPMALTGLTVIGSYDHTWTSLGGVQFNDDAALNLVTGDFTVTAIPGLNDNNSDMLLLSLPAGVGSLRVSTIGVSAGDTINLVIAVPTPSAAAVLGLGGLMAARRRR